MPRVSSGVQVHDTAPSPIPHWTDPRVSTGPRRGLRRPEAAEYIGVSASKFDQLVRTGRMPKPKRIDGCVVWDVRELDRAFDAIDVGDDISDWD